jgi:hypothetical protein
MKQRASVVALVGVVAGLVAGLGGCYGGRAAGEGAVCEEPALPCRPYFACVSGRCVPAPGSPTDGGVDTADVRPGVDGPTDAPADVGATDAPAAPETTAGSDASEDAPPASDRTAPSSPLPDWYDPAIPPRAFVLTVRTGGTLWLQSSSLGSLYVDGPPWTVARDLQKVVGPIGTVDDAAIQAFGGGLSVVARTGSRLHETRLRAGAWSPWTEAADNVASAGLANVEGHLRLCLVTAGGSVTVGPSRLDDGAPPVQAPVEAGEVGGVGPTFRKISCAGLGSDLEIVALDVAGRLWHATQKPGSWLPLRRVANASDLALIDADVVSAAGALHVLGSTRDTQFHAARSSDGTWAIFRDVEQAIGQDPGGTVLAGAEASAFTEVLWFQINGVGDLHMAVRYRFPLDPYQLVDGPGIANVAATVGVLPDPFRPSN